MSEERNDENFRPDRFLWTAGQVTVVEKPESEPEEEEPDVEETQ